jgi:hypothetical protein
MTQEIRDKITKSANSYIEAQNKERAAQGFKAMTAGEEDLVFNAFFDGWVCAIKTFANAYIEELKQEGLI